MNIGLKDAEAMLKLIEGVRKTIEMDTAEFEIMWEDSEDKLPTKEKEVTEFIKRRTRLWRGSWIADPLGEVIDYLRVMTTHKTSTQDDARARRDAKRELWRNTR